MISDWFSNKNIVLELVKVREKSTRYYLSSLDKTAQGHQHIVKSHFLNKILLNMVKNEKSCKLGIKSKRKIAGWDENYLIKILGF